MEAKNWLGKLLRRKNEKNGEGNDFLKISVEK
jgi:hypothetical protein